MSGPIGAGVAGPLSASVLGAIGVGAVLGAWSRHALSVMLNRPGQLIPWGTVTANLVGGLLIGLILASFSRKPEWESAWRPLLVTGFLGALTTFSTFSAESLTLLHRGAFGTALVHSALHLLGSLGAAWLGWRLVASA